MEAPEELAAAAMEVTVATVVVAAERAAKAVLWVRAANLEKTGKTARQAATALQAEPVLSPARSRGSGFSLCFGGDHRGGRYVLISAGDF
ncbi:hypothetical protein [Roseobacter sinensis]|uniref:Uncharacterized protein n=1 Tax=Roseobacter sinensis TaxID=2931391 RepID=A0ABT3BII3_9RHOB|nr:hypothetical protein [Roseobacter sp. WL0113]MCV3273379.1 hypothetical protein [Roseobacter sp. WL0113]